MRHLFLSGQSVRKPASAGGPVHTQSRGVGKGDAQPRGRCPFQTSSKGGPGLGGGDFCS